MKKKSLSLFLALAAMILLAGQMDAQTVVYVSPTGAGAKDGSSWADAKPLGGMEKIVVTGDNVVYKLLQGTYDAPDPSVADGSADYTLITFSGGSKATPQDNVQILGGYTGVGETRVLGTTIINGTDFTAAGSKAIRGINTAVSKNVLISGITFQGFVHKSMGGAIFVRSGGVDGYNDGTVIEDCVFKNNDLSQTVQTSTGGGSIFISTNNTGTDQYVIVRNNVFESNISRTTTDGTIGIGNANTNQKAFVQITGNTFKDNTGGAIANRQVLAGGDVTIANNLFVNNTNSAGAAADINLAHASVSGYIYNNTFVGTGVGVNAVAGISYNLVNNIFAGKSYTGTPTTFLNNIAANAPSFDLKFGNMSIAIPQATADAYFGGNITGTPDPSLIFTDAASDDYTLKAGSPALGAGVSGSDIGYTGSATAAAAALTALPALSGESDYFYIYFSQRNYFNNAGTAYGNNQNYDYSTNYAGRLLTDITGAKAEVLPTTGTDAQLWKAVYDGDGAYLVSKIGGYLYYDGSNYATTATAASAAKFSTKSYSTKGVGEWEVDDLTNGQAFNKNNNNVYVTKYSMEAAGAVQFYTELPSLDLTGSTWYQISAVRRVASNTAFQANGVGEKITQVAKDYVPAQYFKVTGTTSSAILSAQDGTELKFDNVAGDDRLTAAVTGDSQELIQVGVMSYVLKDATDYWNDNGGTAVGYYGANDPGALFVFAPVPAYDVTVTTGSNISNAAITLPSGASVGAPFKAFIGIGVTITYEVVAGYAPVVTVNGEPYSVGTLSGGTYTLTLSDISEATVIDITAEASNVVTVNMTNGIAVTSPTLDGSNQFTSASSAIILFTLADGYENLSYTVNGGAAQTPTLVSGSNYSIALNGISGATTVSISATPIVYNYTVTATNATVTSTYNATYTVEDNAPATIAFTVDNGYSIPYASVNGVYKPVTKLGGSYALYTPTAQHVTSNTAIVIYAYPVNVVPVAEDSYVTSGGNAGIAYNSGSTVQVEYSTWNFTATSMGAYMRRSYFQFNDIPAGYDIAQLRLAFSVTQDKGAGKTVVLVLRTVPASVDAIAVNEITWPICGEFTDNTTGYPLLGESASSTALSVVCPGTGQNNAGDEFLFDIDTDVVDLTSGSIRLQLAATSASTSDGSADFYALENGNPLYVPQLILAKSTGVPTAIADDNAPVRYYTLQGVEVTAPVRGNIYIVKKGLKVTKLIAK
ncbi:MAG: right-handed parallel beta-helix repeat-containing protein [Prevotella sp.]|nr:right-handed parallel beta-helix repeat-containing protein [Prevotella sp.]